MGKFLVTNGSYFEPFTYDELAKPITQAVEAHNAAQDQYDTLASETAALEQYLMREPEGSMARGLYNSYLEKLQTLQDNLWQNGYNAGTRRDLSAARAGYYRDVNRIGNAVKARQERSKEYWDAKHKNPDLITGKDPASYSLDEFLKNDNFGNNWYSYSGKDFEAGVGAEVKARASELIRSKITSDPELVGVLTRVRDNGFTNAETLAAGTLAKRLIDMPEDERRAYYAKEKTSDPVIILSESIISRYNATGARYADMDDTERNRFLDYGTRGYAQGILGKEYKDFDDKEFEQDQKKDMALFNHRLAKDLAQFNNTLAKDLAGFKASVSGKGGNGLGSGDGYQPRIMGETLSVKSPGYDKWVQSTESESKYYRNGQEHTPYTVTLPYNEGSKTVNNEYEMAELIYGSKSRETIRKTLGGYDIALDPSDNKPVTLTYDDGYKATYKAKRPTAAEAKKYNIDPKSGVVFKDTKTGEINDELSREVSDASTSLQNRLDKYKELNPDIEKMAVSPKKQKKLREENEYPETSLWKDFYPYMTSKEMVGDFSPSVLVGNDTAHDYVRENMANEFIGQFNKEADKDGNVSKGSRCAIYVINDGHLSMNEEPIVNLGDVLGRNKDGSIRTDTIEDIYGMTQDFTGKQYVRFASKIHPGMQFAVDPFAFGPLVQNAYSNVGSLVQYVLDGLDPKKATRMSRDEAIQWGYDSYEILGSDPDNFPLVQMDNGEWRPATPVEIMRNPEFQKKIRQSVKSELTDPSMASVREWIALNHEQHTGESNANAEPYF